jgi:group I intron endonuclease
MGFIYKITNTITNKCYIGETIKSPEHRWKQHLQKIKKGEGCPALRDAINAHGLENFTFEVILNCPDEERFYREIEMIKQYNSQVPNGYNILPGGICGGGFIGKKHTEETIEKIKESGKKFREENPNFFETYREKHTEAMKNVDTSSAVKNSEKFRKAVE